MHVASTSGSLDMQADTEISNLSKGQIISALQHTLKYACSQASFVSNSGLGKENR
jgi:hypothetical protein